MIDALRVLRLPVPVPGSSYSEGLAQQISGEVVIFDLVSLSTLSNADEAVLSGLYIYECRGCVGCGCEAFAAQYGIPEPVLETLRWHAATCEGKRCQ